MNAISADQSLSRAAIFAMKETKEAAEQEGEMVLELLDQAADLARSTPSASGAPRGIDVYA